MVPARGESLVSGRNEPRTWQDHEIGSILCEQGKWTFCLWPTPDAGQASSHTLLATMGTAIGRTLGRTMLVLPRCDVLWNVWLSGRSDVHGFHCVDDDPDACGHADVHTSLC